MAIDFFVSFFQVGLGFNSARTRNAQTIQESIFVFMVCVILLCEAHAFISTELRRY